MEGATDPPVKSFTSLASLLHIRESLDLIKSNNINLVPAPFSNQLSSVQPVWWILVSSKNILWHQRERIKQVKSGNPSGQLCWTCCQQQQLHLADKGLPPATTPASCQGSKVSHSYRQEREISYKNCCPLREGQADISCSGWCFRSTGLTPGVHLAFRNGWGEAWAYLLCTLWTLHQTQHLQFTICN